MRPDRLATILGVVKRALIVVLVVLVVVTGVPLLMGAAGMGGCADCSAGLTSAPTTCVAVLPMFFVLTLVAALVLLAGRASRVLAGRVGSRPPIRPPQLV